ncbi:MAG: AMP-binding protein [Saprospiraceae bacterium]
MIPEIEKAKPEEIKKYQEQQLRSTLSYVNKQSTFYQRLFRKFNINPDNIHSFEDLQIIPPTTKDDLHHFNQDFFCVPNTEIVDYITTSGTLGDPVTFGMTEEDLQRLAYNEFLSLTCAGGRKNDIYQLMVTLDKRFMAGMAYFLGVRKIGAGVVRAGVGSPGFQWDTIQRMKPTILVAVPSFINKLIDFANNNNISLQDSGIKSIVCIGEPIRGEDLELNVIGRKIKERWPVELYSTYASTEMGTSFTECIEGNGGHHHPELLIVELLDDNNEPVHPGEIGEIVITTLGMEAMPLIRFKTGDLCRAYYEPCKCGRTTMRLGPILARKQQMIKLKGTTLYPQAIFEVLNSLDNVLEYIVTVETDEQGAEQVQVDLAANNTSDKFVSEIKDAFRNRIRVVPKINFTSLEMVMKKKFPPLSRKPLQLIDKRKKAYQ